MLASTTLSRFLLVVMTVFFAATCFSQSKTIIGVNVVGEHISGSNNVLGFGATFERQISKHNGFETGVYYRTFDNNIQVYVDMALYDAFTIKEQYVSIPILYKFYSSIVNVSLGPTFDIYTGWTKKGGRLSFIRSPEPINTKFRIGFLGKVSKTIGITKHLLIEPELRYNPVFYNHRLYYGLGVAAKYSL